jgi:hypothetical protein
VGTNIAGPVSQLAALRYTIRNVCTWPAISACSITQELEATNFLLKLTVTESIDHSINITQGKHCLFTELRENSFRTLTELWV